MGSRDFRYINFKYVEERRLLCDEFNINEMMILIDKVVVVLLQSIIIIKRR